MNSLSQFAVYMASSSILLMVHGCANAFYTSRPASPGPPLRPGGPIGPGGPRSPTAPVGPCFPGSPCLEDRTQRAFKEILFRTDVD